MALQLRVAGTFVTLGCLTLMACSDNNNYASQPPEEPTNYSYSVTILNLTQGQPLSPAAVMLHPEMALWQLGESASEALELMAEGGDNSELLANEALLANVSGAGIIAPGDSETLTLTVSDESSTYLSVATMLVNTNDAFVGFTGQALGDLALNDSVAMNLPVWDAGTEANSEVAGTIPGPADGGEGYNATRDDSDTLSYHPGVVTQDDGLRNSVLTSEHRFDNPAVRVIITRLE